MSESKLMFVLWDERTGPRLGQALRDRGLRSRLTDAGVRRVQLDLDDPAARHRQCFARPVRAVVSVWTTGPPAAVTLLLRGLADEVAGWQVQEDRVREPPPDAARGTAVALVRRADGPGSSTGDPWLDRWLAHRAATAATDPHVLGHVQDVVLTALTSDAPPVHAIVEETTEGGDADPQWLDHLVESVATLGAGRELDLVPTRRCVLDLPGPSR
jgi:hypothetical protein